MGTRPVGKPFVESIKHIRAATGSTLKDARDFLEAADWDVTAAVTLARQSSSARPIKIVKEGQIFLYAHHTGKMGAMVELRCETDFASRSDVFQNLGKDLCLHFCAMGECFYEATDEVDGGSISVAMTHQFVKDPAITIRERIERAMAYTKEHIWIKRVMAWTVGDGEGQYHKISDATKTEINSAALNGSEVSAECVESKLDTEKVTVVSPGIGTV